jgi:hypothetical protein
MPRSSLGQKVGRPVDVAPFIAAQILGAVAALYVCRALVAEQKGAASRAMPPAE